MSAPPGPCTCSVLRGATRHLSRFYDEALLPTGLTINQYAILARIDRHGPQTVRALAQRLVMDRSTLGHLLRPLARRDLIEIATGVADRRQKCLTITAAGTALMAEARPLWARAERAVRVAFGASDSEALHRMLGALVALPLGQASPLSRSPD